MQYHYKTKMLVKQLTTVINNIGPTPTFTTNPKVLLEVLEVHAINEPKTPN